MQQQQPTTTTYRPIRTLATTQIDTAVQAIGRRQPGLVALARCAAHNDAVLHRLINRANTGDRDAATVIVWTLLPRASGVIRSRHTPKDWRDTIDAYITSLYLTITDIPDDEPVAHLAGKILSRCRRRVDRERHRTHPEPVDTERLEPHLPTQRAADDIALARVELDEITTAIRDGRIPRLRPTTWNRYLQHLDRDPATPAPGPDRMVALRVTRRLRTWRNQQAA